MKIDNLNIIYPQHQENKVYHPPTPENMFYQLRKFDVICIKDENLKTSLKVGDSYLIPTLVINKIHYNRKKWWKPWVKRTISKIEVMYIGE